MCTRHPGVLRAVYGSEPTSSLAIPELRCYAV